MFPRAERQLHTDPKWKVAYAAQVHDILNWRAAISLSKDTIINWNGPVWYVSYLLAPNPHSVTTPVRLVWNSSQKLRGVSLNDLLMKGPDFLNQIRAVLLRFWGRVYAALGDIRKMYNSVWLEDREVNLHRFLWCDSKDEELGEYAMNLPSFTHFKDERQILHQEGHIDDILTSHNDLEHLKTAAANVERILRGTGSFCGCLTC